jgi:hypothetical protein
MVGFHMSAEEVRAWLAQHGMTIRKNIEGEYRVNFKDGREDTAYYTNDLQDAISTALAMARERKI